MKKNTDIDTLNTQIHYKMIEKLSAMNQGLMKEVTERKNAQEQLMETNQHLEIALLIKSEFLSTMSHEIRTPMNGVIASAELLNESDLDSEQKDYLYTLRQSADLQLSIIIILL